MARNSLSLGWLEWAFSDGELDLVLATNAFGLGIDRSDLRAVVHLAPPGPVEKNCACRPGNRTAASSLSIATRRRPRAGSRSRNTQMELPMMLFAGDVIQIIDGAMEPEYVDLSEFSVGPGLLGHVSGEHESALM